MKYRRRARAVSFISLLLSISSFNCYNHTNITKYTYIQFLLISSTSLLISLQFYNNPSFKQQYSIKVYNISIAMLNPKHIMQLHQAIQLILGPHSNVESHLVNSYIQKGQQILHNLRMTQSYSYLLGHFLNQGASTCNNIFSMDKKSGLPINSHGLKKNNSYAKMFVLLELSKIVCLDNESVWWHLLEFYYSCPERLQNVIIDIVIKHFNLGEAKLSNTYLPFLYYLNANTLNMTNLSKMLNLTYRLMMRLCTIIHSDLYSNKWKIQQIQYMTQTLQYLLTILKDQLSYNNFIEIVTVYILRFVMLANELTGSRSDEGQVLFRQQQLHMINESIQLKNNKLIYTLVLLAGETKNQYIDPHPFYTSQSNTFNNIVSTLSELMRTKGRKNSHYVQAYKIIVYFLLKIKQNREMLQKYRHTMMKMYYNYIVQVEVNKPSSLVINDQMQTNKEYEEQDTGAHGEISYYCKYLLLSQCIKLNSSQLMQSLIKKSEISVIVYLAYSMGIQASSQILQIISVYLQSTVNHPFSKSTPTIICCLRYLYRFDLQNNFHHLIPICTTLLNLRATYSEFQNMVDMILCKVTLNIVTCTQENELWDFVSIWVSNLQHNYMDVNAISFYPVLLIFEALSDYRFFQYAESNHIKNKSEYQIDFPSFFDQLLDLLIEQSQTSKQNSLKNRRKQVEPVWSDNFEIFYKLSAVIVRYICTQKKYNNRISMKMAGCQNCKQSKQINRIVQKSLSHIFKNQLYCTDTAYLYVHSLITKNDVNGIIQFMGNMMTESFWSGFDTNQIIFYGCVFMALCHHYEGKGIFESPEMLSNLMNILQKIFNSQAFPEQSTSKIRSQLSQFTNLITFNELKNENIEFFNSENMKNNRNISRAREESRMNEQYQIERQEMNRNIYN